VTLDERARREIYIQLQKLLVEDAPAVWLFAHPRLLVSRKGVQGFWKDLPIPALDLSEVAWSR
jgi:peptide/nickel transport system substrate-binding protein